MSCQTPTPIVLFVSTLTCDGNEAKRVPSPLKAAKLELESVPPPEGRKRKATRSNWKGALPQAWQCGMGNSHLAHEYRLGAKRENAFVLTEEPLIMRSTRGRLAWAWDVSGAPASFLLRPSRALHIGRTRGTVTLIDSRKLFPLRRRGARRWSQGLLFHQAAVDCARAAILLPLGISILECETVNKCSLVETAFLLLVTVRQNYRRRGGVCAFVARAVTTDNPFAAAAPPELGGVNCQRRQILPLSRVL